MSEKGIKVNNLSETEKAKLWVKDKLDIESLDQMASAFYKECIQFPHWQVEEGLCQLWVKTIVKSKEEEMDSSVAKEFNIIKRGNWLDRLTKRIEYIETEINKLSRLNGTYSLEIHGVGDSFGIIYREIILSEDEFTPSRPSFMVKKISINKNK